MKSVILLLAAFLLLLQACTATRPATPLDGAAASPDKTAKKASMDTDPLIGKIIDTKTRAAIPFNTLVEKLSSHDVIYLSEKHDNPMHHAIQHRIIQQLTDNGLSPVVGFEFFAMDDTPLLLNFVDSKTARHTPEMEKGVKTQMRRKLGWEDQTDTMWNYYWNLLVLARKNNLWAAGLDLDSSLKRRITRKGTAGLTPLERELIFSTHLSDPVYEAHMKHLFKQVHCGMGHERMLARLYDTWLARNDKMALSITQLHNAGAKAVPAKGPVVVIMGNGHSEYGLGVMDRVKALDPAISQINLSISEVLPEAVPKSEYLAPLDLEGYPPAMPADFIWFTRRVSNEDPCKKFKASIERMKEKKAKE